MTRTTITLEDAVLVTLKRRAMDENKSLSRLVSELIREAMKPDRKPVQRENPAVRWRAFSAGEPRIDIADRDALFTLMEDSG